MAVLEACERPRRRRWPAVLLFCSVPVAALCWRMGGQRTETPEAVLSPPAEPTAAAAARAEPARFPPNTFLPRARECTASGSIELGTFSPGRDLVYVEDPRVWWESDHDVGGDEDDHSIHKAIEPPLRRLIELVCREGGTLEVQDAYRPEGLHGDRSLHREGRALDVTCDQFPLEKLAKLAWVAGFDWVYHEINPKTGAHVHCSVRRR
jgi:hypothetical protein